MTGHVAIKVVSAKSATVIFDERTIRLGCGFPHIGHLGMSIVISVTSLMGLSIRLLNLSMSGRASIKSSNRNNQFDNSYTVLGWYDQSSQRWQDRAGDGGDLTMCFAFGGHNSSCGQSLAHKQPLAWKACLSQINGYGTKFDDIKVDCYIPPA